VNKGHLPEASPAELVTKRRRRAPKTQVYLLTEGDWFVRGTDDVAAATSLLLAEEDLYDVEDGRAADVDLEPKVSVERTGLFRFAPCWCGDHGWHLENAAKPGHGVFPGVRFDSVVFEEIEYESDTWLEA
jgi:hypothetical protein